MLLLKGKNSPMAYPTLEMLDEQLGSFSANSFVLVSRKSVRVSPAGMSDRDKSKSAMPTSQLQLGKVSTRINA